MIHCKTICSAFPALPDQPSVLLKGTSAIGNYHLYSLKSHHNSISHNNCSKSEDIKNKNCRWWSKRCQLNLINEHSRECKPCSARHSMLQARDLPSRTFQDCYTCRDRMVWTYNLEYNIILTKSAKSLFQAQQAYYTMQFADIVALLLKELKRVRSSWHWQWITERKTCGMHLQWCQCDDGYKSGGVTQQLQLIIGRPVIVTHCIAHRLELLVLDVVKTSSYLNRI